MRGKTGGKEMLQMSAAGCELGTQFTHYCHNAELLNYTCSHIPIHIYTTVHAVYIWSIVYTPYSYHTSSCLPSPLLVLTRSLYILYLYSYCAYLSVVISITDCLYYKILHVHYSALHCFLHLWLDAKLHFVVSVLWHDRSQHGRHFVPSQQETGGATNIHDGSVPLSVPGSLSSEPACTITDSVTGSPERTIINVNHYYTWAFSALTWQNVCREKDQLCTSDSVKSCKFLEVHITENLIWTTLNVTFLAK